jgi:hypothetical protein
LVATLLGVGCADAPDNPVCGGGYAVDPRVQYVEVTTSIVDDEYEVPPSAGVYFFAERDEPREPLMEDVEAPAYACVVLELVPAYGWVGADVSPDDRPHDTLCTDAADLWPAPGTIRSFAFELDCRSSWTD